MALPILSLAVSMIEPPFGAALVTAVGFAPLEAAGFFTTTGTAITLAPITVTAEIKHRAAGRKVTHTLTKGCGMSDRHRFGKGALDNWRRSWQDDSRLIGAPLIGATNEKTPVAETTGVLLCTSPGTHPIKLLAVPKPPSAMIFKATAAFGDEADSLPRPACVQISTFLAGCGHTSDA